MALASRDDAVTNEDRPKKYRQWQRLCESGCLKLCDCYASLNNVHPYPLYLLQNHVMHITRRDLHNVFTPCCPRVGTDYTHFEEHGYSQTTDSSPVHSSAYTDTKDGVSNSALSSFAGINTSTIAPRKVDQEGGFKGSRAISGRDTLSSRLISECRLTQTIVFHPSLFSPCSHRHVAALSVSTDFPHNPHDQCQLTFHE